MSAKMHIVAPCFFFFAHLFCYFSMQHQILGTESGWHPIPLTDVVTAVAVKKAYRKATLCVHPDKLQQRGASIQQKYVCEKVFDLLKVRCELASFFYICFKSLNNHLADIISNLSSD